MADKIKALFSQGKIVCENTALAKSLYDKSRFGSLLADGRVELSLIEAVYLQDKGKLDVINSRGQSIDIGKKGTKRFSIRYPVFRDLRNRGYIVKTALKFGADFRVYAKGRKPGQAHAKWIVFCVKESESHTWHDFSAKNRVAHSTKKNLLIAVVDDEGDVSYWEVGWVRP
ncbi:tRNA-intron lyase [Candidatus Woesearchaeota archaeon]|nr:tRNA-intron lyase [Candidatus Woesearchaeota archaeon]